MAGRDRTLEDETRRLDALLAYARDQAELQTREYGLRLTRNGYTFIALDARRGAWLEVNDDVLRARSLPAGLEFDLVLEGRRVVLDRETRAEALTPHVGIASTGDFTSFELTLRREGGLPRQTIKPLEDGSLEVGALVETGAG